MFTKQNYPPIELSWRAVETRLGSCCMETTPGERRRPRRGTWGTDLHGRLFHPHKLLQAFAGVRLARVNIALRVGSYLVQRVELAGIASSVTDCPSDSTV